MSAAVSTALTTDVQDPDPDVFHQTQGVGVVTSTYEGLLRYLPNSTTVEPALAQAWKLSGDGLTYTFTMRQGVMFHDGTLMDSMAAKTSFERRSAINAAPAYMLSAVAGYDTPDPLTFVIRLKHPVSAFADYLASPYGPKLESPMALTMHGGTDRGQTWLKTHDAGTGPFQISEYVPGDHYLLQRFDNYWGPAPLLRQVRFTIVPDLATQQMQLQSGQLQMVLQGLTKQAQATIAADPKFSIVTFLAEVKAMLFVNPNKGIFADPGLRSALRSAIARQPFLDQVYGTSATVSAQMYPAGELPTALAVDSPKYDPTALAAKVAALSTKSVDLAYSTDDPRNQLDAQIVQMVLQAAGLTVTLRGTSAAQTADLPNHPDQAPDLLLTTVSPDSGSPDSWGRQFYYAPGGANGIQNYLRASVPGGDALLDQGLTATDRTVAQQSFAMAGDQYAASGDWITLVDVKDVLAAHTGYVNFIHQAPVVGTIRWGDVKLGP